MAHSTLPLPLEFHNGEDPLTVEISLTKGYTTIIDAIDGDLALQKWYPANKEGRVYVWNKLKGRDSRPQPTVYIYRVIMERMLGRSLMPGEIVDHADNDPLNNRRSNLRLADKRKNATNSKKRTGTTSQYKGVSWSTQAQKWIAEIKVKGKKKHLGTFADEQEAHEAYRKAAEKYHGEFARTE